MRIRARHLLPLLLLAGAGSARAADPDGEQRARRSFERGEEHFRAGRFADALGEYQQGYDQLPLPGFLINIAQCQRRLGELKQARATYRKFIMVAPDSPYVPEVKELVAELERLIEAPETAKPPDPAPPERVEPERGVGLVPPPMPMPMPVPAAAPVASPLVESPPTPAPPPAARGTRWWLWGTAGAAVLLGAATTAYLLKSPENTTAHDGSLGTLRR